MHGGARAGSGRPSKEPATEPVPESLAGAALLTPLQFWLAVMNDPSAPMSLRARAAQLILPYLHHPHTDPDEHGEALDLVRDLLKRKRR